MAPARPSMQQLQRGGIVGGSNSMQRHAGTALLPANGSAVGSSTSSSVRTQEQPGPEPGLPESLSIDFSGMQLSGYVPRSPKLRPGEIRVLGHTLHPRLVEHYVMNEQRWRAKIASDATGLTPAKQIQLAKLSRDALKVHYDRKMLNKMVLNLAGYLGIVNDPSMMLPEEIGINNVEKFTIQSPPDPRLGLNGKLGCRMLRDLTAEEMPFIAGPYRSYVMGEGDYDDVLHQPLDAYEMLDEWEMQLESYSVDQIEFPEFGENGNVVDTAKAIASGFAYGNEMVLVNDCVVDPFEELRKQKSFGGEWSDAVQTCGVANSHVVQFLVRGWPFLFLVVLHELDKGQELLYSYGKGYWQTIARIQDLGMCTFNVVLSARYGEMLEG